jgi:hypothetical protein
MWSCCQAGHPRCCCTSDGNVGCPPQQPLCSLVPVVPASRLGCTVCLHAPHRTHRLLRRQRISLFLPPAAADLSQLALALACQTLCSNCFCCIHSTSARREVFQVLCIQFCVLTSCHISNVRCAAGQQCSHTLVLRSGACCVDNCAALMISVNGVFDLVGRAAAVLLSVQVAVGRPNVTCVCAGDVPLAYSL